MNDSLDALTGHSPFTSFSAGAASSSSISRAQFEDGVLMPLEVFVDPIHDFRDSLPDAAEVVLLPAHGGWTLDDVKVAAAVAATPLYVQVIVGDEPVPPEAADWWQQVDRVDVHHPEGTRLTSSWSPAQLALAGAAARLLTEGAITVADEHSVFAVKPRSDQSVVLLLNDVQGVEPVRTLSALRAAGTRVTVLSTHEPTSVAETWLRGVDWVLIDAYGITARHMRCGEPPPRYRTLMEDDHERHAEHERRAAEINAQADLDAREREEAEATRLAFEAADDARRKRLGEEQRERERRRSQLDAFHEAMERWESKRRAVIIAVLVGAAIGALVGVLLIPEMWFIPTGVVAWIAGFMAGGPFPRKPREEDF